MNHLNIDIETYSSVSIKAAGAYKYAQSPDFEILLFAYSLNDEDVKIVDLAKGEVIPKEIIKLLDDSDCIKHAYNAAFEWWCLNQAGYKTDITQWHCTMIQGLYCGYPGSLEKAGQALKLSKDKMKNTSGKNLIKYFSVPCKPTKKNGGRTRNYYHHDPEKWEDFKKYCIQDVVTEKEILNKFNNFPMSEAEWENWHIDVLMNSRGVRIDRKFVENALTIDDVVKYQQIEELKELTGLSNPNSNSQLLKWLQENMDCEVLNLQKDTITELLEFSSGKTERVLELRQESSKTSTKKYVTMLEAVGEDDRIRGLLQFYGANRTGRWAGRLVQVQNLPRNYLSDLDFPRELVLKKNIAGLETVYGSVSDTLSQLIRTAFVPAEGKKFIIADFSAIEARVITWLAGEQWRLDVFKTHGKIYEASASQMFGVPLELITKGNPEYELRSKGKVAELALGYQGSVGALLAMGADKMGIDEAEMQEIVNRWRKANQKIVALWYAVGNAATFVIETSRAAQVKGIILSREGDITSGLDFMTIKLPSGRKLYYAKPGTRIGRWNNKVVVYRGVNQTKGSWEWLDSYGGKLVENIVQAIARDCLAESIKRVKNAGYNIVMHIHDELVIEADINTAVEEVCDLMGQPVPWAPDLLLRADGFETYYYKKD